MADGEISQAEREALQAQLSATIQDLMRAQALLAQGAAA
jgi:hypothetical protein